MNAVLRPLTLAVLTVLLAGCNGGSTSSPGSSGARASTGAAPTPPPQSTPYQVPVPGSVITSIPVVLTSSTTDFPARTGTADCHGLIDDGWTGDCGSVPRLGLGGAVRWVVEHQPTPQGPSWVALLYTSADGSTWTAQLGGGDDTGAFVSMAVKTANLTGVGHPLIVVGARLAGPQSALRWDVVDMHTAGGLSVIAGEDDPHGVIEFGSSIIEYLPQITATSGDNPDAYTKVFCGYKDGRITVTSAFSQPHRPTVTSQL